MITKFYYYPYFTNLVKSHFTNIIKDIQNNDYLFNNLAEFCKLDYKVEIPFEAYDICYYNKQKINRLNKNTYLVNNIIAHCTQRKYIHYLYFIQQICKDCFGLTFNSKKILYIKFTNNKYDCFGGHADNINDNTYCIRINKKYIINHEFTNFHLLLHEYLHCLLHKYNLSTYFVRGFFEEGLIEMLINQNRNIICTCKKYINKSHKRNKHQGNEPSLYILFKIWVYNFIIYKYDNNLL